MSIPKTSVYRDDQIESILRFHREATLSLKGLVQAVNVFVGLMDMHIKYSKESDTTDTFVMGMRDVALFNIMLVLMRRASVTLRESHVVFAEKYAMLTFNRVYCTTPRPTVSWRRDMMNNDSLVRFLSEPLCRYEIIKMWIVDSTALIESCIAVFEAAPIDYAENTAAIAESKSLVAQLHDVTMLYNDAGKEKCRRFHEECFGDGAELKYTPFNEREYIEFMCNTLRRICSEQSMSEGP
ncbi:Hypothetical protein UVM_LOCUS424 [uncultured virus]|nr:Hypothetical protein UVM_LOCUS424 [uncultured virus]